MLQVSWPWLPASVSPSWDLTNTPRCCRSWRDMWRWGRKGRLGLFCVYSTIVVFFPAWACVISRVWGLIFACLCPHQEAHPDYSDILKATAAFKSLVVSLEESRHICLWVLHLFKFSSPPNPPQKLDCNKLSFGKVLILFLCFMLILLLSYSGHDILQKRDFKNPKNHVVLSEKAFSPR